MCIRDSYWTKLERLGYPDAGATREYLEQQLAEQQAAASQPV